MARHARPSTAQRLWSGASKGLSAWAARARVVRTPGKHERNGTGRGGRDRQLVVAAVVAAAAVYGAFFVLGRPAGRVPPPQETAAARHTRAKAARAVSGAAHVVTATSVPDGQPTPPPVIGSAGVAAAGGPGGSPAHTAGAGAVKMGSAAATPAGHASASRPSSAPRAAAGHRPAAPSTPGGGTAAGQRTSGTPSRTQGSRRPTAAAVRVASALRAVAPGIRPPVAGALLAGFGWAYSPVFSDWQEHTGVDLAAAVGDPVTAPARGVVLAVRHDPLWGWVVSLALPGGYSTNLSALGSATVHAGQKVRAGQALGRVGLSPPAEGNLAPHVFWQVFDGTSPINPLG